jgi:acetyl esterase/lipase
MTELVTEIYKRVGDVELCVDVCAPAGEKRPVIFWIHGGALIGGSRVMGDSGRNWYLDRGYAVVSIDYRLAPETKLPGIIDDVRDAWRWLHEEAPKKYAVDTSRTTVVGHSAGGYLTLMCGFTIEPRPTALVSFYGYGDIIGPWYSEPDPFYCRQKAVSEEDARSVIQDHEVPNDQGQGARGQFYLWCRQNGRWPEEVSGVDPSVDPDWFDPYMPVRNVTPEWPPTLLLHGQVDTDVPHDLSSMMAEEFARIGVDYGFLSLPGGWHGFDGQGFGHRNVDVAFAELDTFLARTT